MLITLRQTKCCFEKCRLEKTLRSSTGFSIIEIVAGLAVLLIGMVAISSALFSLRMQFKALDEKMALVNLSRTIQGELLRKDICSKTMALNAGTFTFPTASFPPTTPIPLTELYSGSELAPFLQLNQKVAGASSELRLTNVEVKIRQVDGNYVGDLELKLGGGAGSFAPLRYTVQIATAVVGGNTIVTGCSPVPTNNCSAMGGTLVAGVCTNFIGQVVTAIFRRISKVAIETPRGNPPGIVKMVQDVSADPASIWYEDNYHPWWDPSLSINFLNILDGGACNSLAGWKLLGCFSSRMGTGDTDLIAYSEIINGQWVVTGCITNDSSSAEFIIQCVKNY
jgi:hypothetical protein